MRCPICDTPTNKSLCSECNRWVIRASDDYWDFILDPNNQREVSVGLLEDWNHSKDDDF